MCRQIEIDSKFLESQHIMDYSLLLGVHYRAPQHLRSLMSTSRRMKADGLEIVAEEGMSPILIIGILNLNFNLHNHFLSIQKKSTSICGRNKV